MLNLSSSYRAYIANLPKMANQIHPGTRGVQKIKKNVRFCMWGITNPKPVKTMLNLFSEPTLSSLLTKRADILEKPLKPYVCVNWNSAERTKHLIDHFAMLNAYFGDNTASILTDESKPIFEFQDAQENHYQVKLFRGETREGSLGLKLVDEQDRHIYSVTFHLSQQDKRVMYIGALQGPSDKLVDRHSTIKLLTKATHGIRTKALMLEFALMFAHEFNIDEVQGVSNKGHIYQAWRYLVGSKGKAVTFNYDQLWEEYGSVAVDKYLFSIPVNPIRKDPVELKKTKRKLYEKRYVWLDNAESVLRDNLKRLAKG